MIRASLVVTAAAALTAVAALTWARWAVQPSRGSDGYPLHDD